MCESQRRGRSVGDKPARAECSFAVGGRPRFSRAGDCGPPCGPWCAGFRTGSSQCRTRRKRFCGAETGGNDLSSASVVESKPPIRQTGNEEWAQFREEWLKYIERLQSLAILLAICPSLLATPWCTRI